MRKRQKNRDDAIVDGFRRNGRMVHCAFARDRCMKLKGNLCG
jgi:hypothetical protein